MSYQWIASPLTVYAVVATGGIAALYLMISTKVEMRLQQKRHLAECQSLREALGLLEAKILEMGVEAAQQVSPPAPCGPFTGLNVHKRSDALRMYRRGGDSRSVSSALGLPHADVALLQKVHHLLNDSVA